MAARSWCPTEWLDEANPVNVDDPSEALRLWFNGLWYVVPDDLRDGWIEPGEAFDTIAVTEGDIVLWSRPEALGTVTVTKQEDGSFVLDAPMPEGATEWWCPEDHECCGDTLQAVVSEYLEVGDPTEVSARRWIEDVPFRFEIVAGRGRFVQCERAN